MVFVAQYLFRVAQKKVFLQSKIVLHETFHQFAKCGAAYI